VETASRLKLAVRKADTAGRLGGDEFTILPRSLTDICNVIDTLESPLRISREPFQIDGKELILTLSIGIVVYPKMATLLMIYYAVPIRQCIK
jgi:diguanylate cyclase (GGDEF)-like protein